MATTRGVSLQSYLAKVRDIRSSGHAVNELSYYPALSDLFNGIGSRLDPVVKAVMNLRNTGAGLPDGGLFTADQLKKIHAKQQTTSVPNRGAIEAKGAERTITSIFDSRQAIEYSKRYGQLLITNLREFALVVDDSKGRRVVDSFRVADSDGSFWKLVDSPSKATADSATGFEDFLIRALARSAPLREAHDIAMLLASFAREAKARIPDSDGPGLLAVRGALEISLGLKFEGKEGDQFFHSTLVQTLFYGVFSAWVLWSRDPKRKPTDEFEWHETAWHLHVPMVRSLFEQVATPTMLGPLRMVPILDAVGDALNRVDRKQFFATFDTGQTVQHFYEPFLQKFDPILRKKMGVWFTPPEVVEYMVGRVDHVLRTKLGLPDGIADSNVYILDPCAGTGSFIVAALRKIGERIGVGTDATAALKLKKIALTRVYGFELIPAPYVVAHLQIGLLLQSLKAPLKAAGGNEERAQVYLSNALTGWTEEDALKSPLPFPQFTEEHEAATRVKRESPILVVIGNPPYDGFGGVSPDEERDLIEPYKRGLKRWGLTKNKLDDPYIRFFRIAEKRISEHTPFRGLVCYISNYSWINSRTAAPVRESLLSHFDEFWVDDLHGNRRISEHGPDGKTSETIFSLPGFSPGIQQGVAVSTWLKRNATHDGGSLVHYRDDFNASDAGDRRAQMLASLCASDPDAGYVPVVPEAGRYFSFKPGETSADYRGWASIEDFPAIPPSLGLNENRKGALLDVRKPALEERMRAYFGDAKTNELVALGASGIVADAARFNANKVRDRLKDDEAFDDARLVRFAFRPMDIRWAYLSGGKLWNEARGELTNTLRVNSRFIAYRRSCTKPDDGVCAMILPQIGDQHVLHTDAYFIPFMHPPVGSDNGHVSMFDDATVNLSLRARAYLQSLGYDESTEDIFDIWYHSLAIANSPTYASDNAEDLAVRPPRIPLPATRSALQESAALGRRIAILTDTDSAVPGVTTGKIESALSSVAELRKGDGSPLSENDLAVTAGWGRRSASGISGGRGNTVAWADGQAVGDGDSPAGRGVGVHIDAYLNSAVLYTNIPNEVWHYSIAGYQVLKKWLSYREQSVLGRHLDIDEAREFTQMARRIAALLSMSEILEGNYKKIVAEAIPLRPEFPT